MIKLKMLILVLLSGVLWNSKLMAQSAGPWHSVLTCDGGAVVVDNQNRFSLGRSGYIEYTAAQVVIRNTQIVQYFINALHMQPGAETYAFSQIPHDYYATGSWVENGQWISSDVPHGSVAGPAGAVIKSFTVDINDIICKNFNPDGSCVWKVAVNVKYDGSKLSVVAVNLNPTTQEQYSANWNFHNCK